MEHHTALSYIKLSNSSSCKLAGYTFKVNFMHKSYTSFCESVTTSWDPHLYLSPKLLSSFLVCFQNLHSKLCTWPLATLSCLAKYLLHDDVLHSIPLVHRNHHALTAISRTNKNTNSHRRPLCWWTNINERTVLWIINIFDWQLSWHIDINVWVRKRVFHEDSPFLFQKRWLQ